MMTTFSDFGTAAISASSCSIVFLSILLIISAFNVVLLHCILYRHTYMYRLYTIIYLFILCYFSILINMPFLFCFSRCFILTVTVSTVFYSMA